jgi:GNAT superfamily N-acetyltransferase
MSKTVTKLKEQGSDKRVDAMLDDQLRLDDLFDAEAQWCLERVNVLRSLANAGVHNPDDWPESVHWSWAYKASKCHPARLDDLGDARLFGIEVKGQWQSLLFGLCEGHTTKLGKKNRPLVYVDFIEVAPWNWDIALLGRTGKYRGAGVQLMEFAVRWSLSLGYDGRVGLHALKRAESFYEGRCQMQRLGADAGYHNLCYFELTEANAKTFLRSKR